MIRVEPFLSGNSLLIFDRKYPSADLHPSDCLMSPDMNLAQEALQHLMSYSRDTGNMWYYRDMSTVRFSAHFKQVTVLAALDEKRFIYFHLVFIKFSVYLLETLVFFEPK